MKISEKELRSDKLGGMLKQNLRQAPPTPWFTRTVLNRLPPRRMAVAACLEYTLYIVSLVVTIVCGWQFVENSMEGGVRIYDLIVYLTFVATGGALLYMIISPIVLARIRRD